MHIVYILLHIDINECFEEIDECNQVCSNSAGSYICSCNPGYQLSANQKTCVGKNVIILHDWHQSPYSRHHPSTDINECADSNGGCNQTCINSDGSYVCLCGSGWLLNADNHTCDGEKAVNGIHNMHRNTVCGKEEVFERRQGTRKGGNEGECSRKRKERRIDDKFEKWL